MMRTDQAFSDAVEKAVRDAERGTAAELIVVVAARSGPYLDVALAVGAVVALVVLSIALFARAAFPPAAVALEVPVAFALAAWFAHRTPGLVRALAPEARMRKQVERAAAEHFLAEAVHGTRERTGLLVYLSLLEETAALVPDLGVKSRVPASLWTTVRFGATDERSRVRNQDDFVRGIEGLGVVLRERLPAGRADVNELPDAPRILP